MTTSQITLNKFYLFTERGMTDRFFCGNIYENLPTDEIRFHGQVMTFSECSDNGFCKEFTTRKDAVRFSSIESESMEDSNNYATQAMHNEDMYGCEGVDC